MLKRSSFWQIIIIACVGFLLSIFLFHKGRINAQTNTVYVRENIATFMQSPRKVAALRRGIQVMKSRPPNDPTSWVYQANMHGTTDPRNLALWNTCQHGSYFFLPWHRMYIHYFERILRQASGDPTLTLPYWNYSDSREQSSIPQPFRIPANYL
jgi:tyrosinase